MNSFRVPPRLSELLSVLQKEVGEPLEGAWVGATNNHDDVLFVLSASQCRLAMGGRDLRAWAREEIRISADATRRTVLIESGRTKPIRLAMDAASVEEIASAIQGAAANGQPRPTVSPVRMVTLGDFPGHTIEKVHGIVTAVGSLSGWTAASKGRGALEIAFPDLLQSAEALGANAIVGVQMSSFGAAGGITNVFGGDAVGVLIAGTAVTVVPLDRSAVDT